MLLPPSLSRLASFCCNFIIHSALFQCFIYFFSHLATQNFDHFETITISSKSELKKSSVYENLSGPTKIREALLFHLKISFHGQAVGLEKWNKHVSQKRMTTFYRQLFRKNASFILGSSQSFTRIITFQNFSYARVPKHRTISSLVSFLTTTRRKYLKEETPKT